MSQTTTIKVGESAKTITLPEGKSLVLTGSAGAVGVAYLLDPALGGTNSLRSWAVGTGALAAIGPYENTQKIHLTCSAGSIAAVVKEAVLTISATPAPTAPGQPAKPVLTTMAGAVSLAWTPGADGSTPTTGNVWTDINGNTTALTTNPQVITAPAGTPYTGTVKTQNAQGFGLPSAQADAVTPTAANAPYMIAANRLALATDFGTGDVGLNANCVGNTSGSSNIVAFTSYKGSQAAGAGFQVGAKVTSSGGVISSASNTTITAVQFSDATSGTLTLSAPFTLTGQTITQNAEYASGSGVESTGRYHEHRRLIATTWPINDARFLFSNSVQKVEGIVDSKTPFLVQRFEVRKVLAITPGSGVTNSTLVGAPPMAGATSHMMGAGENLWTDANAINLEGFSIFALDTWWQVDLGNVFPSNTTFNLLPGESSSSSQSNLSLSAMKPTGTSSAANGSTFAPSMIVGKGWDGSPIGLLVGDSREDLTNMVAAMLGRDVGHASIAYGSPTGGSMNYLETARYSTSIDVLRTGVAGTPATAGTNVSGVFDWIAARMAQLGQTRAPFQFIHCAHGANTVSGNSTLAGAQNAYSGAVAKSRALWPGIPWIPETILPYVASTNNSGGTDDVNVSVPLNGGTPMNQWGNAGYIQALNTWLASGGGGLFNSANFAIDVATPLRSATNYMAWKTDGFSATLVNAVTANNTGTVTLSAAPALGTAIAFEPGVSNVDTGYIVYAVRQNADGVNWDMDLAANNRAPVYKKVAKAHSAGIAVKGATAPDDLHQSHKASLAMADSIIAAKASVAAIANAYVGA